MKAAEGVLPLEIDIVILGVSGKNDFLTHLATQTT